MAGNTLNRIKNFRPKRNMNDNKTIELTFSGDLPVGLIPREQYTAIISQNPSYSGSASRSNASNKTIEESIYDLKKTAKELRELLKEKDYQIMAQRANMSIYTNNESDEDRDLLLKEIKKLK